MKPSRIIALYFSGTAALLVAAQNVPQVNQQPQAKPAAPPAVLISVPLPLTGDIDQQIMVSADKTLKSLPQSDRRPIVVFEFRYRDEQAKGRTDFERALSLARYLASDRFSRVRTVAYVPLSLEGHAVLPVLACEEIVINPDAEFGAAGRDESAIDATMRAAYREMAERRRTVPTPIVLGMLDRNLSVSEVQLVGGGTRYVLQDELEALRAEGKVGKENAIVPVGDLALISGREMRLKYGAASHLAVDRKELAQALQISPDDLREDVVAEQTWRALRIDLRGHINSRTADDLTRTVREAQQKETANLICLWIDSPGGPASPALRLMNLLSGLDARQLRTMAYVESEARSMAALVAFAADETYVREDAILGGPGDTFFGPGELDDLRQAVKELARVKMRDWSLLMAMIDPQLKVYRCRLDGAGAVRYLCDEEIAEQQNPDQWKRDGELKLDEGITGLQAQEFGLVVETVSNFEAVLQKFNIDEDLAVAEQNPVVSAIERLAAEPWLARTLLFVAFFALISEASAPGIGVAGFLSGVCFLLFFWCQFLNGAAGWLELLLFAGGIACIALEVFVLPGFGVFGIGGGVMVLLSIVLASQTFIFPRNAYQLEQVPGSLFSMVAACSGVLAALWFMRRFLAESRIFGQLMLTPPSEEADLDHLEAMVDWGYLLGKRGTTTTQLTPSGKAQFGDDVVNVISDGLVVPKDTAVQVVQVRGNNVMVEPLDES